MVPSLEPVFLMREYLHPDIADLGQTTSGARIIVNVTSGFIKFDNSDIEAEVLPPGGDWPLIDLKAECVYVNARARAKTDQGELSLKYKGVINFDEAARRLLDESGPGPIASNFGDTVWFTKLDIVTTDERLKWLETAFLVGQGRWHLDDEGMAAEFLIVATADGTGPTVDNTKVVIVVEKLAVVATQPPEALPRRLGEGGNIRASHLESFGTGTNVNDADSNLGLEALPSSVYGLPLTIDYQLGSLWLPDLLEEANVYSYGFVSPRENGQDGRLGGQSQSLESKGLRNNPAVWLESANVPTGHEDLDHDQGVQAFYDNQLYPSRQFDAGSPISLIEAISLKAQNDVLEIGNYHTEEQGPVLGSSTNASSTTSRNADVHRPTEQLWPTISMQEHLLAERSNKITISDDLLTIYHESLENALQCWIDRGTCPYRLETDIECPSHVVNEQERSSSISTSLYDQVHKLDAAFSGRRRRPLTGAEDSGSSKVLKLAVMAFASQWSHESQSSSTSSTWAFTCEHPTVESRSKSDFEAAGAQEFGRLLRLSVWHESQRCLGRWKHCGSFRVILASIVLFCTQPPLDEDEWTDLPEGRLDPSTAHDLRFREAIHPRVGDFNGQLTSRAPSSSAPAQDFANMAFPDLPRYSSSFCGHEVLHDLEIALGHLSNWRRSIKPSSQIGSLHSTSSGSRCLADFNLLFWLGVMCDTTSAVINQRALVMPDTETGMAFCSLEISDLDPTTFGALRLSTEINQHRSHPELRTYSVDIWGSYLLDVDRLWRDDLTKTSEPTTSQLTSKMLQRAVPLKLLFWRKVSRLQSMLPSLERQPTSPKPTEIENAIKEALAVHQYWTVNYSGFFTSCIANHSDLPFQLQSWYLVLVLGWNMACLILAQCIEVVDSNAMSERLGQSLRTSSAMTCELRKSGVYAISEAAKVSCYPPSLAIDESARLTPGMCSTRSSHPVLLSQSALLADPHTEKVIKALEMAAETLLDWLRQWRGPMLNDNAPHLSWLYNNTSSDEISRHFVSCINALDLMKCKSDVSRLTARHLMVRYRLVSAATNGPMFP
ncbi:hypothetical protein LTR84_008467 [Exophiala bonariae]|uniref:C3H1-type domain-containing protein n=1 Tax=Exophiala bonariae TaxID=1690606 RepID=A0AAV9N0I8_9EURO|nr:hypothetical protein LTR84_008467 [Exophiala bonariae]